MRANCHSVPVVERIGPYEVLERVGIGGMAEVLRATYRGESGFEKIVAIKRILPHVAVDDEFVSMFIEEAKIASQLNHANICQIFDLGRSGGDLYIAMEFIDGESLDGIREKGRMTLPPEAVIHIGKKIAGALDYAHRARRQSGEDLNLIHRDITPHNILISLEGQVKLVDFGLAKASGRDYATKAGMVKGKLTYLSPEQIHDQPLDARSDIFGLGVCLWEFLEGKRAFQRDTDFNTLIAIRDEDLPPLSLSHLPQKLKDTIARATTRDRDARFQSAGDFQRALAESGLHLPSMSRRKLATLMEASFPERISNVDTGALAGLGVGFAIESKTEERESSPDATNQLLREATLESAAELDVTGEMLATFGDLEMSGTDEDLHNFSDPIGFEDADKTTSANLKAYAEELNPSLFDDSDSTLSANLDEMIEASKALNPHQKRTDPSDILSVNRDALSEAGEHRDEFEDKDTSEFDAVDIQEALRAPKKSQK